MSQYSFGPFLLDPESRVLVRHGEPVPMAGKTLDTLLLLVQNRGRLVEKEDLLSRVWAGSVVEEANLTQTIFTVRKILGDNPKEHRYIATVAGRGYQFVAPVTEVSDEAPKTTPERIKGSPFWRRDRLMLLASVVSLVSIAMAVWWFFSRRPANTPTELVERQLTFHSGASAIVSAAISYDGKYLAYSDPTGIHLRLLETGEERSVPTPAALSYVDSWSRDGTHLLIDSERPGEHASMWTISLMGQSPRELRSDSQAWSVSPDGSLIAFSPNAKRHQTWAHEIWVMDSHGESANRVVKAPPNESLRSAQWSPDGKRLAYIRVRATDATIETCDLNGANRTTLVAVSRPEFCPRDISWSSDGRIAYGAGEGADFLDSGLWQVAVDTRSGKSAGKCRRITGWTASGLMGLTTSADGKRLALLRGTSRSEAYLAELSSGGTRMSSPLRLSHDEADNSPTAWTSDSKSVLFESNRNGKWGVYKQAVPQGPAEPVVTGLEDVNLPRVSPDGAWVLFIETFRSPRTNQLTAHRMMRVPANGGLPQSVFEMRYGCCNFSCTKASANLCAIEESEDKEHWMITAFDPIKGRGKLLRSTSAGGFASGLSPDGSTYAMARVREAETHIKLLSLTSAPDREIVLKRWPNIIGLDWAPDSKGLYCGFTSSQGGTLTYVELSGATHVLWHSNELGVNNAAMSGLPSPDGRYLAIWGGVVNSNVWMLEGFE